MVTELASVIWVLFVSSHPYMQSAIALSDRNCCSILLPRILILENDKINNIMVTETQRKDSNYGHTWWPRAHDPNSRSGNHPLNYIVDKMITLAHVNWLYAQVCVKHSGKINFVAFASKVKCYTVDQSLYSLVYRTSFTTFRVYMRHFMKIDAIIWL